MKKIIIYTGVSVVISALFWILLSIDLDFLYHFAPLFLVGAVGSTVCALGFGVILLTKVMNLTVSPYMAFGIVDVLIAASVGLFALYDITMTSGMFAGLLGTLLFIFVEPITLLILIVDIILAVVNKAKRRKNEE